MDMRIIETEEELIEALIAGKINRKTFDIASEELWLAYLKDLEGAQNVQS